MTFKNLTSKGYHTICTQIVNSQYIYSTYSTLPAINILSVHTYFSPIYNVHNNNVLIFKRDFSQKPNPRLEIKPHDKIEINPIIKHTFEETRKVNDEPVLHTKENENSNNIRNESNVDIQPPEKLSLMQRFKQMYRDYWYVLVPVHLVTSAFWFGGFYYLAKSGVDVVSLLQSIGISERFTNPLKDSSMGYIAISYALYKIFTPIRYTVTLGGTTITIKYLRDWGYIKPVPSKEELKEMFEGKRDEIRQSLRETTDDLRKRRDNIADDYAHFRKEIKSLKKDPKDEKPK